MYVHGLFLLEECLGQPLRGHVPLAPIAWCVHQRTHEGRGGEGGGAKRMEGKREGTRRVIEEDVGRKKDGRTELRV